MLALVATGEVVCPVPDEGRRYYPWPGVTYVPFSDAPPVRWALIRQTGRATVPVVREFLAAAERATATVQG